MSKPTRREQMAYATIAKMEAEIAEMKAPAGWINCKDKLPKPGAIVIATGFKFEFYGGGRWVEPVIFVENCFHPIRDNGEGEYEPELDAEMNETTHWQALPLPPAE